GCSSTYYDALETLGVHKRDIFVDRIEESLEVQKEGQAQFESALEQFKATIDFDGGGLEKAYNLFNDEYEDSEDAAKAISAHIASVENVADALFEEWSDELDLYTSPSLRRASERQYMATQKKYRRLLASMQRVEDSMQPVLATMRDNVLFLKHNLNARAIDALKGELGNINRDVSTLVKNMQRSIQESEAFITTLKAER
ncbi:MAG: DUF2959 domain-containing protein, partial [Gammaproteobacteria bacterium]|nr:DUF2959 domain-containing protein [Gammaproteobacteria bacterium]